MKDDFEQLLFPDMYILNVTLIWLEHCKGVKVLFLCSFVLFLIRGTFELGKGKSVVILLVHILTTL